MVKLKTEIHDLIEKVNDVQLLQTIKVLLSKGSDSDWWQELSNEEKQAIEKGLKESEGGELIPHNVVMEEIKQISLVYKVLPDKNEIHLITFWDNRRNPGDLIF